MALELSEQNGNSYKIKKLYFWPPKCRPGLAPKNNNKHQLAQFQIALHLSAYQIKT
jgi:hypothetical protein